MNECSFHCVRLYVVSLKGWQKWFLSALHRCWHKLTAAWFHVSLTDHKDTGIRQHWWAAEHSAAQASQSSIYFTFWVCQRAFFSALLQKGETVMGQEFMPQSMAAERQIRHVSFSKFRHGKKLKDPWMQISCGAAASKALAYSLILLVTRVFFLLRN